MEINKLKTKTMNFIEQLQDALIEKLKLSKYDLSIPYQDKLIVKPETITLKELRTIFIIAGIKSITIENTTIKI